MIENTEGRHPSPLDQPHYGAQTLINLPSTKWVTATTQARPLCSLKPRQRQECRPRRGDGREGKSLCSSWEHEYAR